MKLRTTLTPRVVTMAIFFLLIAGHVIVLSDHLWHSEKFRTTWVPGVENFLNYCYAVSALGIVPAGWFLVRLHQARRSFFEELRSWLPMRMALYSIFLAFLLTAIAFAFDVIPYQRFVIRSSFQSTVLVCLDLWALLVLYCPTLSAERLTWPWRYLDVTLLNLVATLVLAEGAVALWASYSPSTLPFDATTAGAKLAVSRANQKPYDPYFNFHFNSRGYHDTEFFRANEQDFVVAVIADSFGLGIVPYAYNWTTITEKLLQEALGDRYKRVAVHNFGLNGIGMPVYNFLLHNEVMETNPTYVILSVFVGNDIRDKARRLPYLLQTWRLWVATKRIWTVWSEKRRGGQVFQIGKPALADGSVPEYIHDPQKEPAVYSEEDYLRIEGKRAEVLNVHKPPKQKDYQRFFRYLADFHARLGNKLIVVVIPDEFQVDDALYERVLATKQNPNDYQREYPQERLRTYCEENGIAMLNLLPVLRKANAEERVYHLRDTHWNARGNRVAAPEIADFILSHHRSRSIVDH